ncbi:hypothetical protein H4R34_000135 [Dimargaris verticillata]|uniref:DASH complex subunit DAD3 n=1 Tax=Dimargaris verticillata TaxID=2761393 RepID=A0A9W8BDV0_9FUNG|nr:hypothetical protein H4R34_000135 [Dimargaris verticillata]
MASNARKHLFRQTKLTRDLSPQQVQVLTEYKRLQTHIGRINQQLQQLNTQLLPELVTTLRDVERQSALVFTLFQSSVYSLIAEQGESANDTAEAVSSQSAPSPYNSATDCYAVEAVGGHSTALKGQPRRVPAAPDSAPSTATRSIPLPSTIRFNLGHEPPSQARLRRDFTTNCPPFD